MHDIDRAQLEFVPEMNAEFDHEQEEMEGEFHDILPETEQLELAAELLEVDNEYELDQFLGSLIKTVGSALGHAIRSPEGQALGGVLKGAVKQILPAASSAVASAVGGPLGAQLGSRLSSLAQDALGLEFESNYENLEFEGAKHFVRLAADAVQNMMDEPASPDPRAAAQQAVTQSVQTHAPALLQSPQDADAAHGASHHGRRRHRSGHWIRRGNKIVLFGI